MKMAYSLLAMVLCASVAAEAGTRKGGRGDAPARPSSNYDELYERYLALARTRPTTAPDPGQLWMNDLMGDTRAHRLNDLVTVRVVETVSASGSADSNLDKESSASASMPNLLGIEKKYPGFLDPTSLANLSAKSAFKGAGSTTRQGTLSAVITARVSEVLPNGDLVMEGIREVEINGDRQIIVMTGVVRPADIGPGNVVTSTAVGQMRIRYFGQGLIRDNLNPGWVVRFLNKVF